MNDLYLYGAHEPLLIRHLKKDREQRSYKMLSCLLELGADVNAMDGRFRRPLHLARAPEEVVLLAQYGARYDLEDKFGRTPQEIMLHDFTMGYHCSCRSSHNSIDNYPLISYLCAIGDDMQHPQSHEACEIFETFLIADFDGMHSEAVLESGYKPKHLKEIAAKHPHLIEKVSECREIYCNTPLPLQRQAANVIRTSLKPNTVAGLKQLQLPTRLESYITLGLVAKNFLK